MDQLQLGDEVFEVNPDGYKSFEGTIVEKVENRFNCLVVCLHNNNKFGTRNCYGFSPLSETGLGWHLTKNTGKK